MYIRNICGFPRLSGKTIMGLSEHRSLGGSASESGCAELVADGVDVCTTNILQYLENQADRSRLGG